MSDFLDSLQVHFAGRYRIERELGGGGMSRVVLARDEGLNRLVVIKLLQPNVTATVSTERFRREIMLAAALQHPNIVPVLSAGEMESLPYFIMPFIDGESLRQRIQRGPLSVFETVAVLKDTLRALAFAHKRGIIHRDIKPDNIMLAAGAAVVTDFGVAKAITAARHPGVERAHGTMTGAGTSLGTPAYMAPEQAAADPATDHRADIYAVGIVGYEMLTGSPPFQGRSARALLTAQLSEIPPHVSTRRYGVSPALSNLVMQCLEKEPAKRPQHASGILRALDEPDVLSDSFSAPTPRAKPRKFTGRNIVVSLVAMAALFVAGFYFQNGRPAASSGNTIAVLPFVSIGGDTTASETAAGIASDIASALTRVEGWRVASQTTLSVTMQGARTPAEVARALDVRLLVEGTVQRAGPLVRVTVRVVNVANDSTMWTETFEGPSKARLVLQDSVAGVVMRAVSVRGVEGGKQ